MPACGDLRVLFRAPAGARRGFGHLVRCRSFARGLGVRPLVAVRGSHRAVDAALRLGCDVVAGTPRRLLRALAPDVLIVDDPVASDAQQWIDEARRTRCAVVTVHDLGLGCREGDVIIDGSLVMPRRPSVRAWRGCNRQVLAGSRYAILDPSIVTPTQRRRESVLIALGGGPRLSLAAAVAGEIAAAVPGVEIRIVTGFVTPFESINHRTRHGTVTWVAGCDGLAGELARARVAVVGGGVSLYEAAAAGVPAVGVAVVPAQQPTVRAFAARRASLAGRPGCPREIAARAVHLLEDDALARRLSQTAQRLVDGRGAFRAAGAVERLVLRQRS